MRYVLQKYLPFYFFWSVGDINYRNSIYLLWLVQKYKYWRRKNARMGSGWGAHYFVKSRQYLCFCISKASKLSTYHLHADRERMGGACLRKVARRAAGLKKKIERQWVKYKVCRPFVKSLDVLQAPSTCFTSTKVLALRELVCVGWGAHTFSQGRSMRRVLILRSLCPHTAMSVSSYYYLCVLILLDVCLHTAIYVSSDYYMCPHTTTYVSAYYYMCVSILLYMCPHITIYVSSDYCVSAYDNIWRMPS
jgi:hypothetical protein